MDMALPTGAVWDTSQGERGLWKVNVVAATLNSKLQQGDSSENATSSTSVLPDAMMPPVTASRSV